MVLATLIIDIILSVLTLIVVILAWRTLLVAVDTAKQSQQTLEITKSSLDLLKIDLERRFRPFKFQVIGFENKSPEEIIITLQFTNDAAQTNRVFNIRVVPKDKPGSAYMLFSARYFKNTSIQPGEIKNIRYYCTAPRDYGFVFEGKEVALEFSDAFGNDYFLEDPQGNMRVIIEGKRFYDFDGL